MKILIFITILAISTCLNAKPYIVAPTMTSTEPLIPTSFVNSYTISSADSAVLNRVVANSSSKSLVDAIVYQTLLQELGDSVLTSLFTTSAGFQFFTAAYAADNSTVDGVVSTMVNNGTLMVGVSAESFSKIVEAQAVAGVTAYAANAVPTPVLAFDTGAVTTGSKFVNSLTGKLLTSSFVDNKPIFSMSSVSSPKPSSPTLSGDSVLDNKLVFYTNSTRQGSNSVAAAFDKYSNAANDYLDWYYSKYLKNKIYGVDGKECFCTNDTSDGCYRVLCTSVQGLSLPRDMMRYYLNESWRLDVRLPMYVYDTVKAPHADWDLDQWYNYYAGFPSYFLSNTSVYFTPYLHSVEIYSQSDIVSYQRPGNQYYFLNNWLGTWSRYVSCPSYYEGQANLPPDDNNECPTYYTTPHPLPEDDEYMVTYGEYFWSPDVITNFYSPNYSWSQGLQKKSSIPLTATLSENRVQPSYVSKTTYFQTPSGKLVTNANSVDGSVSTTTIIEDTYLDSTPIKQTTVIANVTIVRSGLPVNFTMVTISQYGLDGSLLNTQVKYNTSDGKPILSIDDFLPNQDNSTVLVKHDNPLDSTKPIYAYSILKSDGSLLSEVTQSVFIKESATVSNTIWRLACAVSGSTSCTFDFGDKPSEDMTLSTNEDMNFLTALFNKGFVDAVYQVIKSPATGHCPAIMLAGNSSSAFFTSDLIETRHCGFIDSIYTEVRAIFLLLYLIIAMFIVLSA